MISLTGCQWEKVTMVQPPLCDCFGCLSLFLLFFPACCRWTMWRKAAVFRMPLRCWCRRKEVGCSTPQRTVSSPTPQPRWTAALITGTTTTTTSGSSSFYLLLFGCEPLVVYGGKNWLYIHSVVCLFHIETVQLVVPHHVWFTVNHPFFQIPFLQEEKREAFSIKLHKKRI